MADEEVIAEHAVGAPGCREGAARSEERPPVRQVAEEYLLLLIFCVWSAEFKNDFHDWWLQLDAALQDAIESRVQLLQEQGPVLVGQWSTRFPAVGSA